MEPYYSQDGIELYLGDCKTLQSKTNTRFEVLQNQIKPPKE